MTLENFDLTDETRGVTHIESRRNLRTKILDAFQMALRMVRRERRSSSIISLSEYKSQKEVLAQLNDRSEERWMSLKGVVISDGDHNPDGAV